MKKFNLQLFAEAVQGSQVIYLYRILSKAATNDGVTLAFTTENERTSSKENESTVTKDGSILTPGAPEIEITATSILAKGDTLVDELEEAMLNSELIEIWEANLAEPIANGENKFKGKYFQGYLSEVSRSSSSEEAVEISLTFAVNGIGAAGEVTVTAAQQELAAYVFTDTQKTGA